MWSTVSYTHLQVWHRGCLLCDKGCPAWPQYDQTAYRVHRTFYHAHQTFYHARRTFYHVPQAFHTTAYTHQTEHLFFYLSLIHICCLIWHRIIF